MTSEQTGPRSFSAVLRERTAAVHRAAERCGFLADLIRGRADRRGYALFLRNLVPAYEALEAALAAVSPSDAVVGAFADPRLRRLARLRADLDAVAGPGWADRLAVLPEAKAYARAIAACAGDRRLVAHAYARTLGDLSGGQILKPVLARTLGLPPDALAFYDFPALPDLAGAKAAMRDALDRVAPDDGERVAAEAVSAFRHNIAVSVAVSRAAIAAAA